MGIFARFLSSRSLRLSFQSKSCFTARAYATRVLRLRWRIFGGKELKKAAAGALRPGRG